MSILIWAMVGIAVWHFAVLVPDRFCGGIIGAFLAALLGALVSAFALPTPGILPGSLLGLAVSYLNGALRDRSGAGDH